LKISLQNPSQNDTLRAKGKRNSDLWLLSSVLNNMGKDHADQYFEENNAHASNGILFQRADAHI
jgi:hypothetical protein